MITTPLLYSTLLVLLVLPARRSASSSSSSLPFFLLTSTTSSLLSPLPPPPPSLIVVELSRSLQSLCSSSPFYIPPTTTTTPSCMLAGLASSSPFFPLLLLESFNCDPAINHGSDSIRARGREGKSLLLLLLSSFSSLSSWCLLSFSSFSGGVVTPHCILMQFCTRYPQWLPSPWIPPYYLQCDDFSFLFFLDLALDIDGRKIAIPLLIFVLVEFFLAPYPATPRAKFFTHTPARSFFSFCAFISLLFLLFASFRSSLDFANHDPFSPRLDLLRGSG